MGRLLLHGRLGPGWWWWVVMVLNLGVEALSV